MADIKTDPTRDPEFQKVIRHFVTTPPKPHSEMKLGKRKAKPRTKANWPKKALDGARIGKIVGDFIRAAYPRIMLGAAPTSSSPSLRSRRASGSVPLDSE
jgi:hypothetical protein